MPTLVSVRPYFHSRPYFTPKIFILFLFGFSLILSNRYLVSPFYPPNFLLKLWYSNPLYWFTDSFDPSWSSLTQDFFHLAKALISLIIQGSLFPLALPFTLTGPCIHWTLIISLLKISYFPCIHLLTNFWLQSNFRFLPNSIKVGLDPV